MSFPVITYQQIVNILLNSMYSCANVDSNYTSLASQFKSGYSNQIALPVWWDSSYTDKGGYTDQGYGYTDQGYTSGQGTDYRYNGPDNRYNGPDYRGDYNKHGTTDNHVVVKSSSVISQVTSSTIQTQMTAYLTLLGLNNSLNTNVKEDKFLWFINNLSAYYKARVRWASSIWNQTAVPIVYLSNTNINTPFYSADHKKDNSWLIKAVTVNDIFDVFTPIKLGNSTYRITYTYTYTHNRG